VTAAGGTCIVILLGAESTDGRVIVMGTMTICEGAGWAWGTVWAWVTACCCCSIVWCCICWLPTSVCCVWIGWFWITCVMGRLIWFTWFVATIVWWTLFMVWGFTAFAVCIVPPLFVTVPASGGTEITKKWHYSLHINSLQPKVFGNKFSLREIEFFFPLKYAILSFLKCLNYKI